MSCNGCRILRKACSEDCILRQSLSGIENPNAQANATLFVSKFFGRAGLASFLSSVPQSQRPALFKSLLYEACGRTVNPVDGAVGLLGSGKWHLCQAAVDTVLRGGVPRLLADHDLDQAASATTDKNNLFVNNRLYRSSSRSDLNLLLGPCKRRACDGHRGTKKIYGESTSNNNNTLDDDLACDLRPARGRENDDLRAGSPVSDKSETINSESCDHACVGNDDPRHDLKGIVSRDQSDEPKLLRLFI